MRGLESRGRCLMLGATQRQGVYAFVVGNMAL
ncbi:hypothetical protein SHPE106448_13865 [Shewanella pealeana]